MKTVGQHVVYVDPRSVRHDALVTAVWGPNCVNLLFVVKDENQKDDYGRKIERSSSCSHQSVVEAHGNFWYDPAVEECKFGA